MVVVVVVVVVVLVFSTFLLFAILCTQSFALHLAGFAGNTQHEVFLEEVVVFLGTRVQRGVVVPSTLT